MSTIDPVVIVGGGLAAWRTALALREGVFRGRIVVVSGEIHLPYDRPPLSKRFLLGKVQQHQIQLLTPLEASEQSVDIRLANPASALDRSNRRVLLSDGASVDYGAVVIATGARPLMIPALAGFSNVHVLRTVEDAVRLRAELQAKRRVGIIGAGFVGLEIASAARESGCEVRIIESAAVPLLRIVGEEVGSAIRMWHESNGVEFHCDAQLVGVGGNGRVESLLLGDGTAIDVDTVLVGIGQTPNVEWLEASGLDLHPGIVCDSAGRTSDPHVFAVGDVACCRIGDRYHPTRHWTATTAQTQRVANAICGVSSDDIPDDDGYFWSDQYGVKIQSTGTAPADAKPHWIVGTMNDKRFLVVYRVGDVVTGVFSLGCPREFMAYRGLLSQQSATLQGPS